MLKITVILLPALKDIKLSCVAINKNTAVWKSLGALIQDKVCVTSFESVSFLLGCDPLDSCDCKKSSLEGNHLQAGAQLSDA